MTSQVHSQQSTVDSTIAGLTRSIHELSTSADDAAAPIEVSHLGVLNVLSSTPPRPKMRKLHWHRRLADLATKPHEYFGLSLEDVIQHSTGRVPIDSKLKGRQDARPHNQTRPIVGAGFQPALQSRAREHGDRREERLRGTQCPLNLCSSAFLISVCE